MAYSMFGSWTALVSAMLACACGGTSESSGAGGAHPGVILGRAGDGSGAGSNGLSGSSGLAGSGAGGAGSSGAGAANSTSTCPVVTPCGGNLVGDWAIKQECVELGVDAPPGLCAGTTIGVSDLTAVGTVSFKADNTMSTSGTFSFTETIRFPGSCFTADQCTAYAAALSAQASVMNPHCAYAAATGCSCTMTASQVAMSSGTYQVQGSTLTITSTAAAQPEVDSFCVAGNTLSILQSNADGTSATLILTK